MASSLFLQHNDALVPPYRVLIDTNFINFSLQNKLELVSGMMDCLFAKCRSFVSPVGGSLNWRELITTGVKASRVSQTVSWQNSKNWGTDTGWR